MTDGQPEEAIRMAGKPNLSLVVVAMVSGLMGGAVSALLLRGGPATAQTGGAVQAGAAQGVVKAKGFEVVDDQGKTRAVVAMTKDGSLP